MRQQWPTFSTHVQSLCLCVYHTHTDTYLVTQYTPSPLILWQIHFFQLCWMSCAPNPHPLNQDPIYCSLQWRQNFLVIMIIYIYINPHFIRHIAHQAHRWPSPTQHGLLLECQPRTLPEVGRPQRKTWWAWCRHTRSCCRTRGWLTSPSLYLSSAHAAHPSTEEM